MITTLITTIENLSHVMQILLRGFAHLDSSDFYTCAAILRDCASYCESKGAQLDPTHKPVPPDVRISKPTIANDPPIMGLAPQSLTMSELAINLSGNPAHYQDECD